jgi:hypothetical protein
VIDGRAKGLAFENDVCRLFSVWTAENEADRHHYRSCPVDCLSFRRRPAENENIVTDWEGERDVIHRPGIYFPFTVECKKIEGWELDGLMHSDRWPVWGWWDQAVSQAAKNGLPPLLVFTRNRRKTYALIDQGTAECLTLSPVDGPILQVRRSRTAPVALLLLSDLARLPMTALKRVRGDRPAPKETIPASRPGKLKRLLSLGLASA